MLSAYIRLAEVGIGCTDWPDCYAQLSVAAEKKGVTVLTDAGRDMAHYGARVAHRYIATVLGLFVVLIVIVSLRQGAARTSGVAIPLAIFAVTVFLSLLGYYPPTRSNPLITMGNLLGGMVLLALLWWLMQREVTASQPVAKESTAGARWLARLALLLITLQIVSGGWSSANYASANCPELLSCQKSAWTMAQMGDAFNPFRKIELKATGEVVRSENLAALSVAHRYLAIVIAAYLAWLVRRLKPRTQLQGTITALSIFSIGQLALGLGMIWLNFSLALLTLHNAVAACLLLSAVNLLHCLTPPAVSRPPD